MDVINSLHCLVSVFEALFFLHTLFIIRYYYQLIISSKSAIESKQNKQAKRTNIAKQQTSPNIGSLPAWSIANPSLLTALH